MSRKEGVVLDWKEHDELRKSVGEETMGKKKESKSPKTACQDFGKFKEGGMHPR